MVTPMRIKPVFLVAGMASVGLAGLAAILYNYEQLPPHGRMLFAALVAVWMLFTVLVCVPTAAIAQAARNKRYGVFSHLRHTTTEKVKLAQGEKNVAEEG